MSVLPLSGKVLFALRRPWIDGQDISGRSLRNPNTQAR